jgi:hypothetical protein
MLETWGAAIWTTLTTLWFWIILAVGALLVGITVEILTRNQTSLRAAIGRAFVAMLVAPAVFYGIQRGIEAPERATEARDNQRRTELLNDIAARVGNPDAAKELIELRARALFSPSTGDAERFAHELVTQLPEKQVRYKALQDDSAKEVMRRRLDWEPFFHAFLEQFDHRVAALQSRNMVTDVSTGEVALVHLGPRKVPIVRSVRITSGYELKVRVFTGQLSLGQLISSTWVELFGTLGGETDRHFMRLDFNPSAIAWTVIRGSDDSKTGSYIIGNDPQVEEYRQAVQDGLNFAFEYAVLAITR